MGLTTIDTSKDGAMEDDIDAIEAIHQWRAGESKNILTDDTLICECMCISVADIKELFKDTKDVDLKILQEQLSVGQGCSTCLRDFRHWKDKIF